MKVTIYAACDVFYGSYYIKGMYDLYGERNVSFSIKGFPKFDQGSLAIKLQEDNIVRNVAIDFWDTGNINRKLYEWCDVYGKVNLKEEDLFSPLYTKVQAVGPSFGIKLWPGFETAFMALRNLLKSYSALADKKKFIACYFSQSKRLKIEAYYNFGQPKPDYVFALNTLWKKEPAVNDRRLEFVKECLAVPSISFEGGFAPRTKNDIKGFEAYTTKRRYKLKDYINKTKKSCVVFNTSAVTECHGWKLGEFFALGKAIITTPLTRMMPSPLEDNVHFLIASPNSDYASCLSKLLSNIELRKKIEKNSLEYYKKFLSPEAVMSGLVKAAFSLSTH